MFVFRIEDSFYEYSQKIWIGKKEGHALYMAKPLEFVQIDKGQYAEPTFSADRDDGLVNTIYSEIRRLGIIESADKATNEALKYHLEDMRKLVFKEKSR